MSEQFKIKISFVVFGTNIDMNKKYILSLEQDNIIFPHMTLSTADLSGLDEKIIQSVKNYVYVNDLELLPQLITLNSLDLPQEDYTLNVVYGFVIGVTQNINNAYWYEFDFLQPNQYTNLLFEVIQKLR